MLETNIPNKVINYCQSNIPDIECPIKYEIINQIKNVLSAVNTPINTNIIDDDIPEYQYENLNSPETDVIEKIHNDKNANSYMISRKLAALNMTYNLMELNNIDNKTWFKYYKNIEKTSHGYMSEIIIIIMLICVNTDDKNNITDNIDYYIRNNPIYNNIDLSSAQIKTEIKTYTGIDI